MINIHKIPENVLKLNLLTPMGNSFNGPVSTGPCQLPIEFDTKRFASAYHLKGAGVNAARSPQKIQGTNYVAQGWEIWKYPNEQSTGEVDKATNKPKMDKHPMAGQPHEVSLSGGKESGGMYVLMFRPIEVQEQVNLACALLSRERMEYDLSGETVGGAAPDAGLVTEKKLKKLYGTESSDEPVPQGAAIHGGMDSSYNLRGRVARVSQ